MTLMLTKPVPPWSPEEAKRRGACEAPAKRPGWISAWRRLADEHPGSSTSKPTASPPAANTPVPLEK